MGGKTKTKTTPIYGRQIEGAANTLSSVYKQQAPKISGYADAIGDTGMDLLAKYKAGNPMIDAAENYVTSTLNSDSAQNPYLDDIIGMTNDSVRNQLQAKMGTRGTTGGSAYYDMIGRGLAQNESGLRYTDFNNAEARKAQAAGLAPGVAAGDFITLAPALSSLGAAAQIPMGAATQYAAGTGGLLGQYTNTTQKQGLGNMLGGILGAGLGGWASGGFALSDARAKENIERVGETDGGQPLYRYNYKGDDEVRFGPLAQEVAALQPDNLGPVLGGYMTVNYGELR